MFRGIVEGCRDTCVLCARARDEYDGLISSVSGIEKVRYGELGRPDGMDQIDVKEGISAAIEGIATGRSTGRMPKVAERLEEVLGQRIFNVHRMGTEAHRFIHASARTDYVNAAEMLLGCCKHALKLEPISNISLLKDSDAMGVWLGIPLMLLKHFLSLWPQG